MTTYFRAVLDINSSNAIDAVELCIVPVFLGDLKRVLRAFCANIDADATIESLRILSHTGRHIADKTVTTDKIEMQQIVQPARRRDWQLVLGG